MMRKDKTKPALALLAAMTTLGLAGPAAAAGVTVNATYTISIAGFPIGRADAATRIEGTGYALSVNGFTSGLSRIVSDATAQMESFGRLSGRQALSGGYTLDSKENGLNTSVRMKMNSGSVATVVASPPLSARAGRIPITAGHLQNVVDPISAFIVPAATTDIDGQTACARTLRIFDGWQRFDIRLSYKETRTENDTGAASKSMFVCSARFVPVAGHIPDTESVKFMTDNKNMEVWLATIPGVDILIPYRIQVGTMSGDLTIRASSISTGEKVTKASVQ